MNIDILASNPSWWLYIPFAAGTIILTLAIWILFKTKKGVSSLRPLLVALGSHSAVSPCSELTNSSIVGRYD